MANRRSISDALARTPEDLTPETVAFIQSAKVARKPVDPEPDLQEQIQEPEVEQGTTALPTAARRTRRTREPATSQTANLLPQLMVPITTRLQPETAQALRRAHLEQKLRGQSPATQQEIAEEAIHEWLRKHGYLS